MRIFRASEAVSPAFARTKLILFSPFRFGRTWKLCATAYVSRMGTIFFPFPLIYLFALPFVKLHAGNRWMLITLAAIFAFTGLFIWIFALCSRLQFAFFDVVLNRGDYIAPAWRRYGPASRRWLACKAVIGTVAILAMGLPMVIWFRHLIPLMIALPANAPPPPEFFSAFFLSYFLFFFGIGGLYLVVSLLSNFMLPSLALEDTSLAEGFRRFRHVVIAEPGQMIGYFFIKLGLAVGGYMALAIAYEIVAFVLILLAFAVGLAGLALLHAMHAPHLLKLILGIACGVAFYLFVLVYGIMFMIGPLVTFLDAYLLYFLGGRYPMLGDLLDRSTPQPPASPQPLPYAFAPDPPNPYAYLNDPPPPQV